jgi:hypothetical protein
MAGTQRALSPKAHALEAKLEATEPEPKRAKNCRRLKDKVFSTACFTALFATSLDGKPI